MRNFVAKSNSLMKESAARVRGRVTRTGNKPYRNLSVLKRELALVPRIFLREFLMVFEEFRDLIEVQIRKGIALSHRLLFRM